MLQGLVTASLVPIVRGLLFCMPWWYRTLLGAMRKFYHPKIWKSIFVVQSLELLLEEVDSKQLPVEGIGGTASDGYNHALWCDRYLYQRY